MKDNIEGIIVKDMKGNDVQLSSYKGRVLLIVNVASKCGYTPQYADLQKLYEKYRDKGFEILAFPCNDFGQQESGTNTEIKEFCSTNFGVTFKLFDKIKVIGDDKSLLYERLTNNSVTGKGDIKWNFEKFIISRNGKIVDRFSSKVTPMSEDIITVVGREITK
ncbi:MAG: glutathione peroxidase [Ignavibacteria bacterium RBG_13_36_8]|nr:MAG: glutathione peroxidase [Ignavibacteria bacterium RBG_13_36_8]